MAKAPLFFDPGEVTLTILLFDGLERLSLKPLPLLTDLEHAELVAIRGGCQSPAIRKQGVGRAFSLLYAVKINVNCHSRFDRPATGIGVKSKRHTSKSEQTLGCAKELGREPIRSEISTWTREKKKASKAKGKKRALAIKRPPSFKIQSKCLQERYGGKAGALLLKSQVSRLLGVKGAEIGDIDVDSDMGAEENSVGDIDENESVVNMESMVDSEEDGSCMVDDE
ncbi:hypothetical protein C8F04DRAFT_1176819 [Mycena alexandri]|uniref:Uncharacterized protein n=1 Tax=Mycena alexandri TaxID=1745969 RepID=A0AAD6T997_9AGAR|nr:hypothetical protein C8F04DRAFT_1176819 [Mycena alexandri]